MIIGSPVTISSNELEPTRFDSMSKASTSTGIPYVTLPYAKKNSRHRVHSNGKEYTILMSSMAWVKRCYSEKSKNLNKLLIFEALYP